MEILYGIPKENPGNPLCHTPEVLRFAPAKVAVVSERALQYHSY